MEQPYIDAVIAEWQLYAEVLGPRPVIREIHLGGGTPTFFSPCNLQKIIDAITANSLVPADHEFSVEVHPNYTTVEHLNTLALLGFNRISMGVQDFDPRVQHVISRIQSFEQTRDTVEAARSVGFTSVNIDLVYGLPLQTISSIELTVDLVSKMTPDRIAFYSYAHVPWKSKVQRRYTEADLPPATEKWNMYHRGRSLLEQSGMISIGMDHFSRPGDKLLKAWEDGKMHRNFMGYTTTNSNLLVGLGASAISDSWMAFTQNEKNYQEYQQKVKESNWPVVAGHRLSEEDLTIRKHILDLMCRGRTYFDYNILPMQMRDYTKSLLLQYESDGLVALSENEIVITSAGQLFVRIVCSALDIRLWKSKPVASTFSKSI